MSLDQAKWGASSGFDADSQASIALLVTKITLFTLLLLLILRQISWKLRHPFLNDPRAPPLVQTFLPYVGSGFEFRRDPIQFVLRWSRHFQTPVFSAYMGGKTYVFITDPVAAFHILSGRVPQLSWRPSKFALLNYGMGMFDDEASNAVAYSKRGHSIFENNLMKEENLEEKMRLYQEVLNGTVAPSLLNRVEKKTKSTTERKSQWAQIGILEFFGGAIWQTTADSICGFPSLANTVDFRRALQFNKDFLPLLNSKWSRSSQQKSLPDSYNAREDLVTKIHSLYDNRFSSQERKTHSGKDLSGNLDAYYQDKMDLESRCRYHLMILMASMLNTVPTIFWIVYHMLADREAYEAVRAEVLALHEEVVRNNGGKINGCGDKTGSGRDVEGLTNASGGGNMSDGLPSRNDEIMTTPIPFALSHLDQMECLDSLITETLRLRTTHRSFRFRTAMQDLELKFPLLDAGDNSGNTKKTTRQFRMKEGTVAVLCPALQHRDGDVFDDALTFRWDRFLSRDDKPPLFMKNGLELPRPVEAFGGGPTMCPGRKFARAEMKALVASMLVRYDIRFVGGNIEDAPMMENPTSLGSSGMPGKDVMFEFRPRQL